MNNYKLLIQYDGGRYQGWQRLGNGENTIQGKLEQVLSALLGEPTELIGCSRTDAGVHALAQTAHFKTALEPSEEEIKLYFSQYLPHDIGVLEVSRVPESFHARYCAKNKTYLYQIWNRTYPNPFLRKYSMHVRQELDLDAMRQAAGHLLGAHDFTAFSNAKSKKKSMVRLLHDIQITQRDGCVRVRVRGSGFLHQMVRRVVGTLVAAGSGAIHADSIPDILQSKERKRAGYIADACGLFLEHIDYSDN
ncbi:MAG: tRNA pseudouridine(38-40) synthase TruA [Oscillospiraceae bacterium]|nr:tRNA pseudouridine(38-40) synthase TruA [Oscillospiraceae bacterium]